MWASFARVQPEGTDLTSPAKRRYSSRKIVSSWIGAGLAIVLAWSFVYREHIQYSMLNPLLGGKRVAVSDSVAWRILSYKTPAGQVNTTVAGEVASVLAGTTYRVIVIRGKKAATYQFGDRDGFTLEGVSEAAGLAVKAGMVITKPRAVKLAKQVKTLSPRFIEKPNFLLQIPSTRFVENLLVAGLAVESPLGARTSEEHTAVVRLIIRHMLAMSLYYDGSPQAENSFRDVVAVARLLEPRQNAALAVILKSASYYFARVKRDTAIALETLRIARSFSDPDRELDLMEAYLLVVPGQPPQAQDILGHIAATADDPAQLDELWGESYIS